MNFMITKSYIVSMIRKDVLKIRKIADCIMKNCLNNSIMSIKERVHGHSE